MQKGDKIEISSSELPIGATVEVIGFVDANEQDTIEYLLSTEANRTYLYQALQDIKDPTAYTYVTPDDL